MYSTVSWYCNNLVLVMWIRWQTWINAGHSTTFDKHSIWNTCNTVDCMNTEIHFWLHFANHEIYISCQMCFLMCLQVFLLFLFTSNFQLQLKPDSSLLSNNFVLVGSDGSDWSDVADVVHFYKGHIAGMYDHILPQTCSVHGVHSA